MIFITGAIEIEHRILYAHPAISRKNVKCKRARETIGQKVATKIRGCFIFM